MWLIASIVFFLKGTKGNRLSERHVFWMVLIALIERGFALEHARSIAANYSLRYEIGVAEFGAETLFMAAIFVTAYMGGVWWHGHVRRIR